MKLTEQINDFILGRFLASSVYAFLMLFLCVNMLCLSSCGYRLQGSQSILPNDVKTVYIELSENATLEPGLEIRYTEILRSRFERYGALTVVDDRSEADAVLKTKIVSIENQVKSVTGDTDIELEVDLIMVVAAELRRTNGQVLWRDPSIVISDSYASTSDSVVTSSAGFAQGSITSGSLASLSSREVSRGQSEEAINALLEESARTLYMSAVAADF